MRDRISEIGEHTIAHVLRNYAPVASCDCTNSSSIRLDRPRHDFRVQARRQCIRADEVAEHNGQVTSFRFVRWLSFWFGCRRGGRDTSGHVKLCDGAQHLATMPKQYAKFFEILVRQIAKNRKIDKRTGEGVRGIAAA